jgi:two-component sensor histidine kinase
MTEDISGWMTVDLAPALARFRNPPKRDLRLEVEELRIRLREAEETASRHAMLLREGDHRIKNSLQIVASLMNLQASRETTQSAREALKAAGGRIMSVARIHDALQANAGTNAVNLGDVLTTMCEALDVMAGDPGRIAVVVDVETIDAPVALAQPLALAVNELVVNALRHAFPGNRRGVVIVSVAHASDHLCISVADDGVGLPDGYAAGAGYGIKLVNMMARQLGGQLRIESDQGSKFTICAPLECNAATGRIDHDAIPA